MLKNLLIVDDDPFTIEDTMERLAFEGYKPHLVQTDKEALLYLKKNNWLAVLLDYDLGKRSEMDGLELLSRIAADYPTLPVIIITGHHDFKLAVRAIKRGAFNFVSKPIELEYLIALLRNAAQIQELRRQKEELLKIIGDDRQFVFSVNPQMKRIYETIERAARSEASILILGETGTGKDVVARQIHALSSRKDGPFIAVNCAAIPENLLESEFFGHTKGAFTGAYKNQIGKFKLAHKGTIFLDEVGELSPALQAKLLNVLDEKQYYPVGSEKPERVDVRVICATNQDLGGLVAEGKFRMDLFYRINAVSISLVPLRLRKEDIPLLAQQFLEEISAKMGRRVSYFTRGALLKLAQYDYPGNIRELRNLIEKILIFHKGNEISSEDIPLSRKTNAAAIEPISENEWALKKVEREFRKDYISKALQKTDGSVSEAAKLLQVSRSYLHKMIHELDIKLIKKSEL